GLLLAVPIVIHLMKQQNAINLVFPSISFIIKGKMPREGRRKLRDIILLLIRMLIFSLVILALAGPHFGNGQKNSAETGKTLQTAIILDTSSSMNGWDSMKNAEKIIKEILSSTENSEFELLTSSDKVRVAAEWTTKKKEILEKFRTLKPSLCEGRHENAVAETLKTFKPDVESRICIVSDFQLTDWSFPAISLPLKNLSIDFMECSPGRTENVGIAEAQAVRTLNGSTDIIVKVQNFGILNQTRTLCVRSTSGKIERNITIPPRKTVKTVLPLGKSELESVEISLGNDSYTPDDSFSLWTGRELPIKIAAFAPPERNDELFFLQRAFSSAATTVRQFDYSSLDSKEFKDINLNSLSIIFLVGACADFSDNDYKRLDAFLEKGGTVVVTPGTEPGNSFLGLKNNKLLSADYQGISDRGGIYGFTRISQINPASPFFLLFEENENTDIKLFPIYRFSRLTAKKPAETLISMEDKFPFLLRQSKGSGTLFAFSVDFSMVASEFPVTGSFLPVLHEIVQGGKNRKDCITAIKCGE
ncbi:MAG: BatA domain-containing protein, partial [Lentisphaerae bacterium]|nr:BatA domain-containing protein [Lentisphaerota bacterium]